MLEILKAIFTLVLAMIVYMIAFLRMVSILRILILSIVKELECYHSVLFQFICVLHLP